MLGYSLRKASFPVLCVICAAAIAAPAQTFTVLTNFSYTNGAIPYAPLIQGNDGNFYGTTNYGAKGSGEIFSVTPGGSLSTFYNFCSLSGCTDGTSNASLVLATDGNFYGTTFNGGTYGYGTVFRVTPGGVLTTLYSFDISDGAHPTVGLIQAADGNFYGTTGGGGTSNNCTLFGTNGCGTVFKITPQGALTPLHSFNNTDGEYPDGLLVEGTDGNLYGTTFYGGTSGVGTVFKIGGGVFTSLHSFDLDGGNPEAGLVQATNGNFYGTTFYGGGGSGTVFEMDSVSYKMTTLHVFQLADGANPVGLVQAADGSLYGTTDGGGSSQNCSTFGTNGCGTLFQITLAGTLTTLHNFAASDGANPFGAPLQPIDGYFYGTTVQGGTSNNCSGLGFHGCGTVYRLAAPVALSPARLNFGAEGSNRVNTPQIVTLTNNTSVSLLISGIDITGANGGDFAESNNCPISPNTLAPGNACNITVVFSPTSSGARNVDVSISDSGPGSPRTVPLTGIGVGGKVALR